MAQKKEKTSYAVSGNLKTAMIAQNAYPVMGSDMVYFDGAANDRHFTHGQWQDGTFRTLNILPSGIDVDFIDPTDAALVRQWTVRELFEQIGAFPGVQNYQIQPSGNQWRYFIIRNNVTYEATNANPADACALAFTQMLNAV